MLLSMRDEKILYTLDNLGYATTSQLQRIHDLGSLRNAQRIMQRLSSFVHSRKIDEYIFYLSKKGREAIGSDKKRTATMQLQHAAMRTEAYIIYSTPTIWRIEHPVTLNDKVFLIPDVTFAYNAESERYLVEIDCHQHMRNNYKKLDKYAELKERAKDKMPALVWLTRTRYRKDRLEKALNDRNLEHYLYSLEDIK